MVSYVTIQYQWDHTVLYRTIQYHTVPDGTIWDHTGPYWTIQDHSQFFQTHGAVSNFFVTDWLTDSQVWFLEVWGPIEQSFTEQRVLMMTHDHFGAPYQPFWIFLQVVWRCRRWESAFSTARLIYCTVFTERLRENPIVLFILGLEIRQFWQQTRLITMRSQPNYL